jgi:signal transduction histidine kinase
LHLEDNRIDRELIELTLRSEGFEPEIEPVQGRDDFLAALGSQSFDLVLADYRLPQYDGSSALEAALRISPDTPFILVSGTMGEEVAVESMKGGATDYVLKTRLDRLGPCVRRALHEAQETRRRKQAEEALRESSRRKSEFLAMLSHELRNPLAAIHHAIQVWKEGGDAPGNVPWVMRVIEHQGSQLARMLDDLLDVTRISRGRIQLHPERMDAASALDQAAETLRPLFLGRRHELVTAYQYGEMLLDADPTRLEQIIVNLLSNAARYTEPGGTIWLEARRDEDEVMITVRDTGRGIAPDDLPKMFDVFAQAERSIERSEGGLGLGLSIVQGLVELHGGTIMAQSDGIGFGSKFTVRLAAAASPPPPQPVAVKPPLRVGQRGRVLVVDDNLETAQGLGRLLRIWGYEVDEAYDGFKAVEIASTRRPAHVLLDIGLPGMNGYEVARLLRAEACRESVLIAITGYGQEEDRQRSREAGFDWHCVKPVETELLHELLSKRREDFDPE